MCIRFDNNRGVHKTLAHSKGHERRTPYTNTVYNHRVHTTCTNNPPQQPCVLLATAQAAEASKGDERASRLTGKAFFMRQYAAGVEGTEEGAAGSDSEGLEATEYGEDGDFDDDDEDDDFDPDAEGFDSEDEDLLDEYLAAKGDD